MGFELITWDEADHVCVCPPPWEVVPIEPRVVLGKFPATYYDTPRATISLAEGSGHTAESVIKPAKPGLEMPLRHISFLAGRKHAATPNVI